MCNESTWLCLTKSVVVTLGFAVLMRGKSLTCPLAIPLFIGSPTLIFKTVFDQFDQNGRRRRLCNREYQSQQYF
jgi:hypothetical protein